MKKFPSRESKRSLARVLKRLQIRRATLFVTLFALLLSTFTFVNQSPATAATVGSASCVQTVGSSSGVVVTQDGNHCVVQFTGSNTWTPPAGVNSITYLIVGGGGAGGTNPPGTNRGPGGGGAGGLLAGTATISAGTFPITVGAGGAGRARDSANVNKGNNGESSSAFGLTAIGGGGGGATSNGFNTTISGADGGSGGGGANHEGSGGSGTLNQGKNGGRQSGNWPQGGAGGGGGGAGTAGSNASDSGFNGNGGDGGNGLANSITGVSTVYAGGGGGAHGGGGTAGAGGSGGGGRADTTSELNDAQSGQNGTGGGGGASRFGTSGSGGSGIVIVRYALTGEILRFDATNPDSYTSGTTWNDLASAKNGSLVNGAAFNSRTKAFDFDGVDDYVDLPDLTNDLSNGFSIHFVADFGVVKNWERVFEFSAGGTAASIALSRYSTTNQLILETFNSEGSASSCQSAVDAITPGFNSYSLVVQPNGTCQFYRNGVASSTTGSAPYVAVATRTENYIGAARGPSFFCADVYSIFCYVQHDPGNTLVSAI